MKFRKNINWVPTLFISIYQTLLIVTLPFYFYYHTPSAMLLFISFVLLYLTGFSITAGYHRYYAHKSYKSNTFFETVLLFFGSMTAQGSALRWAFDHRIHHAHVDTDNDPYNINRGFLYAHCLWIIDKPREIEAKVVPDLLRNKLVMFQHNHIGKLIVLTNFIAFYAVGWLLNDFMGAFFIALWLRLFALHHFTWFINSLAHIWGDKPFSQEHTAVNNFILAMLTFGEGYHNYHHTFANDYRNGVRWYQFDPTKWLIWTLNKLHIVHDLKRTDALTIKKRMVIEHKNLLLERLKDAWHLKVEEIEAQVHDISDEILNKIQQFNQLKAELTKSKLEKASRDLIQELKLELNSLNKSMRQDFKLMKELTNRIMNPPKGAISS
jgi:stearoyl-CoA desaturase (delta-9 desaturase)